MPISGDNPLDDGLDFVGCTPQPTKLKLPEFPENFKGESKLICWGRCIPFPDGEKMMIEAHGEIKRMHINLLRSRVGNKEER